MYVQFNSNRSSWSAPTTGTYTFQVWGAQGGSALNTSGTVLQTGPLGGYAAGNYSLTSGQALYVYVGGQGSGSTSVSAAISGGFNEPRCNEVTTMAPPLLARLGALPSVSSW